MALLDLINKNVIRIPLESTTKETVIPELVDILCKTNAIKNCESVVSGILERENLGSTGLDKGIAVPHTRTNEVDELCVALGISPDGIDFNSLDGQPAHLFFLILSPPDQSSQHIRILSEIAKISRNESICEQLKKASDADNVLSLLSQL